MNDLHDDGGWLNQPSFFVSYWYPHDGIGRIPHTIAS
jgi:hypothetical protein